MTRLNEDRSRLSFSELQVATIGALLSTWDIPVPMAERALRLHRDDLWIKMLTEPMIWCLSEPEYTAALILFGRHWPVFISSKTGRTGHQGPDTAGELFLLRNPPYLLLDLMKSRTGVGSFLRKIVLSMNQYPKGGFMFASYSWVDGKEELCEARIHTAIKGEQRQISSSYKGVTAKILGKDAGETWDIGPAELRRKAKLRFGVGTKSTEYRHLVGNLSSIPVFCQCTSAHVLRTSSGASTAVSLLNPTALKSALVGTNLKLEERLDNGGLYDFCALGLASILYIDLVLDGVTISPKALPSPINLVFEPCRIYPDSNLQEYTTRLARSLSGATTWRIIAFFETEQISTGLGKARSALGLAMRDSIFVPRKASGKPWLFRTRYSSGFRSQGENGVGSRRRRVEGELRPILGRAGDGFTKTSLNIGFTGWKAPIFEHQFIGTHFPSANLLHVADVDITGVLMHKDVKYLKGNETCTYRGQHGQLGAACAANGIPEGMLSVETRDQTLDLPEGCLVARVYGNWVSRLAIASVAALHCRLKAKRVYICPEEKDWCWVCLKEVHRNAIFMY
ncbi:hypothetical protein PspLS_07063 [Pyricularia sp. CBS 133598]|nr:hypothetical protein PspLS_07063 [Pyricularia sp. CBS 133598]